MDLKKSLSHLHKRIGDDAYNLIMDELTSLDKHKKEGLYVNK